MNLLELDKSNVNTYEGVTKNKQEVYSLSFVTPSTMPHGILSAQFASSLAVKFKGRRLIGKKRKLWLPG